MSFEEKSPHQKNSELGTLLQLSKQSYVVIATSINYVPNIFLKLTTGVCTIQYFRVVTDSIL